MGIRRLDVGGTDRNDPVGAIHAAIGHGINLIDTAPMYGYGHSEQVVGEAIKDRRDKVVLATSVGSTGGAKKATSFLRAMFGRAEDEPKYNVFKNLRPKEIRYEVEQSLKRLQTDGSIFIRRIGRILPRRPRTPCRNWYG